jgi:hypothetical protein
MRLLELSHSRWLFSVLFYLVHPQQSVYSKVVVSTASSHIPLFIINYPLPFEVVRTRCTSHTLRNDTRWALSARIRRAGKFRAAGAVVPVSELVEPVGDNKHVEREACLSSLSRLSAFGWRGRQAKHSMQASEGKTVRWMKCFPADRALDGLMRRSSARRVDDCRRDQAPR